MGCVVVLVLELVAGLRERKESPGMSSTLMVEDSVQHQEEGDHEGQSVSQFSQSNETMDGVGWGSQRRGGCVQLTWTTSVFPANFATSIQHQHQNQKGQDKNNGR